VQATTNGVGPALRAARRALGLSLAQASRDTRIRVHYLQALEREDFPAIRGDVYARGFLRTYSSYLGLDPEAMLQTYSRAVPPATTPAPSPVPKAVQQGGLRVLHRTGNWRLALVLAVLAVIGLAATGMFSGRSPAPVPSPQRAITQAVPGPPARVTVVLTPLKPVRLVVVVDGEQAFAGRLYRGNTHRFTGTSLIRVQLSCGACMDITANGHSIGAPGTAGAPYGASFGPEDFRGTPSANNG
jgi:cytoskeleton protein RodZ